MKKTVRCLIGVAVVVGLVAGGCYAAGDKAQDDCPARSVDEPQVAVRTDPSSRPTSALSE